MAASSKGLATQLRIQSLGVLPGFPMGRLDELLVERWVIERAGSRA